jgi:hypothetical protein
MSLYLENMRTNYSSWMQVKVNVVIPSSRGELFWERSLLDIIKTCVAESLRFDRKQDPLLITSYPR